MESTTSNYDNLTKAEKQELLLAKYEQLESLKREKEHLDKQQSNLNAEILAYEQANKIMFFGHDDKGYLGKHGKWEPNPVQKKAFKAIEDPSKRIILLAGGNQIGKTLAESCVALAFLRGHWPWEKYEDVGTHLWDVRGWTPPIKIRWIGQAWETHIKMLVEKGIEELLPTSWSVDTRKNNQGVKHEFTDTLTGSQIQFMSTEQDVRKHEGSTMHLCLYDEPPPRDIYVANSRGLVAQKGVAFMGCTLLNEGWITEQIINKVDNKGKVDRSVVYIHGSMWVNEGFGLDKEGIINFENNLSEEERDARVEGIPVHMSSLVLKIDKEKNIIDRFEIPSNWIVDIAIDIGVAKPHDITYLATDEKNLKYVIFAEQIKGDGTEIARSIINKIQKYNLRTNDFVICDYLAKSNKNETNTTWNKIDEVLNRHNLYLKESSKEKEDGIIAINSYLKTINGMPALFFFEDCVRAIQQCINWVRDKKTGLPDKKNDDQCENLYRIMIENTQYVHPEDKNEVYYDDFRQDADVRTGY